MVQKNFRSPHVAGQHLCYMFPLILTFNFDLINGSFLAFLGNKRAIGGLELGSQLSRGLLILCSNLYCHSPTTTTTPTTKQP